MTIKFFLGTFVKRKGNDLMILSTESFKRHAQEVSIHEMNLKTISKKNREKLGVAVGKVIANNLIISFENIVIKRGNGHAR